MDTPAPRPHEDLTDHDGEALLEWPLPQLTEDAEIRETVQHEAYDEQILAALVSP